jgi:hypothetical protein
MPQQDADSQSTWGPVLTFTILGIALVVAADRWPELLQTAGISGSPFQNDVNSTPVHPLVELLKLVIAAFAGIVITAVHRRYHRDKPLPRSLLQAQVLLCVAGAMVMIIIGSSVARAFGVAGAAGIVRFRTPVEDPKDTTILFLLVALGMACGVGLLEIAGLSTIFICGVIVLLDRFGDAKTREMIVAIVSAGKDFPADHVNRILASTVDYYDVREMLQGNEATMKYLVRMPPSTPLGWITQQLMANGTTGIKSVSWAEPPKKS